MRPSTAILAALAVLCAQHARAGGPIYRSIEPDGTVLYTNVAPHATTRTARRLAPHRPAAAASWTQTAPTSPSATVTAAVGEATASATPAAPTQAQAQPQPQPQRQDPSSGALSPASGPSALDDAIAAAALKYRVPVHLVRAVIHAESAFDPTAVSYVGASGLMQLMPQTAREMSVRDVFDERENIEGGTRYLRVLANEFDGDMVKMVAAYNAGPEAVRKYGGRVPPYAETQAYVRKVLSLYFSYKAQAGLAQRDERRD